MSTESQIEASRINGSKSHGPTTPEGKLASSRNATRHGMLSGTIVLKCESTDRFLELVNTLLEEFQPQTPFEESLIENMAIARWRQMRIHGMEKAGIDYEMRRQDEMSNFTASNPREDTATRASLAFRALSNDSRSLELISRYDTRYDRQYYRAHRCFIETRDRRTPPAARPPQPVAPVPPETEPEKVFLPIEPNPDIPEIAVIVEGTEAVAANKAKCSGYRAYNSRIPQRRQSASIRFHSFPSVASARSSHVRPETMVSKAKASRFSSSAPAGKS
jgi:hypothetical protein